MVAENENHAFDILKKLLSYIPNNNLTDAPILKNFRINKSLFEQLQTIIPSNSNKPYNMYNLIEGIIDQDSFFEIFKKWAENIIVGFGRVEGISIGIIANNVMSKAGVLDINASIKAARFIRFCDAFNIPIVTFEDVPGFLPGIQQEHDGIIRNGAKLLFAYAEATVPKITIIIRKSYGGAYCVMNSKHLGADLNLAWPTAEIAVMGAAGAVNIIFRQEIKNCENKEKKREELISEYNEKFANPYIAAQKGYIDDVIEPNETRQRIAIGLKRLFNKRVKLPAKKHGNIPL
jgi:acetyl-CoA carboxylase carboxyltransferase component